MSRTPTHGNEEDLVKEVLGRPESTLIVWHHGTMAKLVRQFPIANTTRFQHWPDERFDLIWVLVRQPGAQLKYRFVVVPQMLLADDEESVGRCAMSQTAPAEPSRLKRSPKFPPKPREAPRKRRTPAEKG
jgi:hypothetical protein